MKTTQRTIAEAVLALLREEILDATAMVPALETLTEETIKEDETIYYYFGDKSVIAATDGVYECAMY